MNCHCYPQVNFAPPYCSSNESRLRRTGRFVWLVLDFSNESRRRRTGGFVWLALVHAALSWRSGVVVEMWRSLVSPDVLCNSTLLGVLSSTAGHSAEERKRECTALRPLLCAMTAEKCLSGLWATMQAFPVIPSFSPLLSFPILFPSSRLLRLCSGIAEVLFGVGECSKWAGALVGLSEGFSTAPAGTT